MADDNNVDNDVNVDTNDDIDVENPDTGGFLPFVIIGLGGIVALSIFILSRKKNKFYKI